MSTQLLVRRTPYHSCKVAAIVLPGDTPQFTLRQVIPKQGVPPECGDLIEHKVIFHSKSALRHAVLRRMRESPKDLLSRAVIYPNALKRVRDALKTADLKGKFVLDELVVYTDHTELVIPREDWTWLLDPNENVVS